MVYKLSVLTCILVASFCSGELAIQWSTWVSCSSGEEACVRRKLTCDANASFEHICNYGNSSLQEYRYNCTECEDEWIVKLEAIPGPSDGNTRQEMSYCSSNPVCVRRLLFSIFDLFPCPGEWRTTQRYCNASCTESGSQIVIRQTFTSIPTNLPCLRTNDVHRTKTIMQSCDNRVCNLWSEWPTTSRCSQSCGSGTILQRRTCLNNTQCNNSQNAETRQLACNIRSCPSWSSWLINDTCTNGMQTRTRACLDRGSLAITCGGGQATFQTTITGCPSLLNQSESVRQSCDQTIYTIIIPVVIGLIVLFALMLAIFYFLFRRSRRKEFIIKDSDCVKKPVSNGKLADLSNGNTVPDVKLTTYNLPTKDNEANLFLRSTGSLNLINEDVATSPTSIPEVSEGYLSNDGGDNNTSFPPKAMHRFASSPDILNDAHECEQSERRTLKPRPSVRRAELMRLKDVQRARRTRRKREQEDLYWNQTQTLRLPIDEDSRDDGEQNFQSDRLRSHSVDMMSEIGYKISPVRLAQTSCEKPCDDESQLPARSRSYSASCSNLDANRQPQGQGRTAAAKRRNYVSDASERHKRRSNSIQPPVKPKRSLRSRDASFNEVPIHI